MEKEKKNTKKERKNIPRASDMILTIFPNLTAKLVIFRALEIVLLICLIKFLPFIWYIKFAITAAVFACITIYNSKKLKAGIKTFFMFLVMLTVIRFLFIFSGKYGIIGSIFIVFLFAGYKIWISRNTFMRGMRTIETALFGKPLDKENWKDKKPKLFGGG